MTPLPRRRKAARRAEILAAARAVFLAWPYEQASVNQIAERAGCVVGTIYGYFENKRDLFDAVLTDFYDRLVADIEPKFALLESTEDRLRYLVARHLQITLDDASWLRVLAREAHADAGYFGSKLHQLNRRYALFLTRTISDGIARGELRPDLDPQLARDFVFGGLEHWVRNTVGRGKPRDAAVTAREITRMMLDGWRAPAPAARGETTLQGLAQRLSRLESRLQGRAAARPRRRDKEATT
jgi:AcrR family transcriptional regulator